MDLKLYGICFKMRGGPDLLDHVQAGTPVPVEMMAQVMDQMGQVTQEELAFAGHLDADWKKAFNEKVPLTMCVAPDGGYDITCTVPDELLATVRVLTGLDDVKIVEEYTAGYLKNVCGVEADIQSVDMEHVDGISVTAQNTAGFDLSDLNAGPEAPSFEDAAAFGTAPAAEPEPEPVVDPEPEVTPEFEEEPYEGMEDGYGEYPEEEPYGEYPEEEAEPEEAGAEPEGDPYGEAVKKIYTELVGNIRDRKLDERLGLRIGQ